LPRKATSQPKQLILYLPLAKINKTNMKIFKRTLIVLSFIFCFAFVFLVGSYFYVKSTWSEKITTTELEKIVYEIKTAEKLPERFYELYEKEYPNSLTYDLEKQIFLSLLSDKRISIPSLDLCRMQRYSSIHSGISPYLIAAKVEESTNQRECLNRVLEKFDFLNLQIGIENASRFYFNKEILDLNDKEIVGIIVLMKNPSLYNPLRRKELFDKEILELMNK
jgi:hypothetical protein